MRYEPNDIKALRTRLSLSQGELAEMLGIHRSNVSRWEAGETRPRGPVLRLLSQIDKPAHLPKTRGANMAVSA